MEHAHGETKPTMETADSLKMGNPNFDTAYLVCGFCHQGLRNWQERQDHVFAHLRNRLPKSSWIPRKNEALIVIDGKLLSENEMLRKYEELVDKPLTMQDVIRDWPEIKMARGLA
jgi:hypothetical protein